MLDDRLTRLKKPVGSLNKFQSQILRLLAAQRDPESYLAGSTPFNRAGFRMSDDLAIFQDREERVARTAEMNSEIHFFPTIKDALWGYVLHPVDLAANKVMAAAGRQRPARPLADQSGNLYGDV